MLTYSIENRNGQPLYQYLYACIKTDILTGTLKANEKLPSKRALASHMKISIITVENAYAQLVAEGYLYSIPKSGYYVSKIETSEPLPTYMPAPKKDRPKKEYLLDFKTNHVTKENFPYATLTKLMRSALVEKDGFLSPLAYNGIQELRDAIADYLYHFREIKVSSEQIIIGAGTEYLYSLIIQLLGRDKIYAMENPGYQKPAKIYALNGVQFHSVNVDSMGLSVTELKKKKTDVIHISPTHHFPTGIVMPIQRRQEILKWANEAEGRYIIEDDYDSEFRFAGRPIQPLLSIDRKEKVIYINTFSKTIAPALRISYMILPPGLLAKYRETMGFYACTVSGFDQYMLAKFISEGYFERHLNRMKTSYRAKRDAVIEALTKSRFHDRITILEENAGLHFLMKIKTDIPDSTFVRLAEEKSVRLSFLSEYTDRPSENYRHILVVNYSGIDIAKLPAGIAVLEEILGKSDTEDGKRT